MSDSVTGVVSNGVIVPSSPLPEGSRVEIHLQPAASQVSPNSASGLSPGELRKLPREQRQAILSAAAALAEQDYLSDKDLTGFDAFSEEELNDDDPDAH